jgi:REP element-mobilizing transposase RayT
MLGPVGVMGSSLALWRANNSARGTELWAMRGVRIYRRRLPHWRLDGATYFVTWRLNRRQAPLSPEERTIVFSVLRHFEGQRFRLHALVVMDDHVHVIVTPSAGWQLGKILGSWKSYSAYRLQREAGLRGAIWQIDSYDRIVRNSDDLSAKIRYIRENPIRRWPEQANYPWLWWVGMQCDGG